MSIRKNKSGTYKVDVYDINNNRIIKTFTRKGDATDFEAKNNNHKRETKLVSSGLKSANVSIKHALEDYRKEKGNLRPRTVQKYNFIIDQFQQFLEAKEIKYVNEFTADKATELLQEITKTRFIPESNRTISPKPKTVNGFLALIRAFFNNEVLKDHIVKNPMIHVKNMKLAKNKPDYFSEVELSLFFQQEMHPAYRLAFQGLLYTGMRINELANIHWDDVDFEKKHITVRRKEGFDPKTDNSERSIPIVDVLYNALKEASKNKKSEKFAFASKEGKQLKERTLLSICKLISNDAKIEARAYLHKFRHTFATHLVKNRVPLERVQKLLGHASINETLIYAHLIPSEMHEDVSVLNNLGMIPKEK